MHYKQERKEGAQRGSVLGGGLGKRENNNNYSWELRAIKGRGLGSRMYSDSVNAGLVTLIGVVSLYNFTLI